jgi:competence protein ComEA
VLAVSTGPEGCRLAEAGSAPDCPCFFWGADLRRVFGLPLPLDRASAADLETLPGIGAARAAAIVAEREAHGAFAAPADLERVPGIGTATAERLTPLLFTGEDDPACTAAGVDPG